MTLTCPHTNNLSLPKARLRGNIANPSSPELLHFLFGPLQMVRPAYQSSGPPAAEEWWGSTSRGSGGRLTPGLLADCEHIRRS